MNFDPASQCGKFAMLCITSSFLRALTNIFWLHLTHMMFLACLAAHDVSWTCNSRHAGVQYSAHWKGFGHSKTHMRCTLLVSQIKGRASKTLASSNLVCLARHHYFWVGSAMLAVLSLQLKTGQQTGRVYVTTTAALCVLRK